jgi:hypothetical protein
MFETDSIPGAGKTEQSRWDRAKTMAEAAFFESPVGLAFLHRLTGRECEGGLRTHSGTSP